MIKRLSMLLLITAAFAFAQWPCPTCITESDCLSCHVRENVGQFCPGWTEDGAGGICWNCCTACPPIDQLARMSPAEKRKINAEAFARAEKFRSDPLSTYGKLVSNLVLQRIQTAGMPRPVRVQLVHDRVSPRVGFMFAHRREGKQAVMLALDLKEAERKYR